MKHQNPVIVVPGITASTLVDDYPLHEDELWSMVVNRDYDRVALHPDNLRYEAIEPAHVLPRSLFPIYSDLIKALRFELSPRADRPTPVFAFPYDWRQSVATSAAALGDFVGEVLARTRLLKHYAGADELKVDLVGHSMGGLVICEYLAANGRQSRIGKVATIATPFQGSVEAAVKMATGMSLLTGGQPREREREAARATPALYQLLPSYGGAVVDAGENDIDIFDRGNMQSSILQSLEEYVRMYSVNTPAGERRSAAARVLDGLLADARKHRARIDQFRLSQGGLRSGDWLAIVGLGQKTRVQMSLDDPGGKPRFRIGDDQFVDEYSVRPSSVRTGDGTVPAEGAVPAFLPRSSLVCVTKDDLAWFELRDRVLVESGGFHGLLPRVNLVQRLVTRHLCPSFGGPMGGRHYPGIRKWRPPIDGLT